MIELIVVVWFFGAIGMYQIAKDEIAEQASRMTVPVDVRERGVRRATWLVSLLWFVFIPVVGVGVAYTRLKEVGEGL